MNTKIVYTPGPTKVRENVRLKRAQATTNPDLDKDFIKFYKNTCDKIGQIINTKNDVYILSGEGILGLEAACASLTEKGDRVLVIDNGVFGKGFSDFVKMYGGEVVIYSKPHTKDIDIDELSKFLEKDNNFKYATIIHCDTPTGVLNDISKICPLLKKYNILTVVDSVSAMGGVNVEVDKWQVDILIGGSQKAISAPSGLTIVSVSDDVKKSIKERKSSIVGFYANLSIWQDYEKNNWFPYTMPISDILGLDEAVNNMLDEGVYNVIKRHQNLAKITRESLKEYGLKLFLEKGYSDTVTAVNIPTNIGATKLANHILSKYNTIIATSLNEYKDKLLRIGHMGENANYRDLISILNIIDISLKELGYKNDKCLVSIFNDKYNELIK